MKVDGGAANNNFLLQFQSDILNIPIIKPNNIETTALGAAMLAGLGKRIWDNSETILELQCADKIFRVKLIGTTNSKPNTRIS